MGGKNRPRNATQAANSWNSQSNQQQAAGGDQRQTTGNTGAYVPPYLRQAAGGDQTPATTWADRLQNRSTTQSTGGAQMQFGTRVQPQAHGEGQQPAQTATMAQTGAATMALDHNAGRAKKWVASKNTTVYQEIRTYILDIIGSRTNSFTNAFIERHCLDNTNTQDIQDPFTKAAMSLDLLRSNIRGDYTRTDSTYIYKNDAIPSTNTEGQFEIGNIIMWKKNIIYYKVEHQTEVRAANTDPSERYIYLGQDNNRIYKVKQIEGLIKFKANFYTDTYQIFHLEGASNSNPTQQ